MKTQKRKKIVTLHFLTIMAMTLVLFVSVASAIPTIELDPEQPKPLESVTFTATLSDVENIEKVTIRVQECGNEPGIGYICYADEFNTTMTESSQNVYTASIELRHENAIEIKYQLRYLTDQGWISYPEGDLMKVDLDTSEEPNGNTNGNDDTNQNTPGFELMSIIAAVSLIVWFSRKRFT